MTSSLSAAASRGPHLRLRSALTIRGGNKFLLHGHRAYIVHPYASGGYLTVVDVSNSHDLSLVQELEFKRSTTSLTAVNDTLLVTESYRALNFLDVSTAGEPDYFECGLALGISLQDLALCGEFAVLAMNWDGVGLMRIDDPPNAEIVHQVKLADGYADHVLVSADRVFVPGGSAGLYVFEVEDGELVLGTEHVGEDLRASKVFQVEDRVWAVVEDDGDDQVWVIDPRQPERVEAKIELPGAEPTALVALSRDQALGFTSNYTIYGYDAAAEWSGDLFQQFTTDESGEYREIPSDMSEMDDEQRESYWAESLSCMDGVRHAAVRDGLLYVTQGEEFQLFEILPGSVFSTER